MSSWDTVVEFFSTSIIPKSEYLYMIFIVGLGIFALWKARKMVSDV